MGAGKKSQGKFHGPKVKQAPGISRRLNKNASGDLNAIFAQIAAEKARRGQTSNPYQEPSPSVIQDNSGLPIQSLPYQVGKQYVEEFTSGGIITLTSYTLDQNKRPTIFILLREHSRRIIHSSLTFNWRGFASYGIKQLSRTGNFNTPIERSTEFSELYKAPWVRDNLYAQNDLRAIEETLKTKRGNIESHLGVNLNLD